MPFCPACRSEYREGFSRCADCDVELVAELAPPPAPARAAGGWSEVYRGDTRTADVIRATLEAAGIKTVAPDEMAYQLEASVPFADDQIRILVATADLPKVREIFQDDAGAQVSENEEELVRFPCPCGQTLETPLQTAGAEMECPFCGRTLTVPEIPREFVPASQATSRESGGRVFYVIQVQAPDGNPQRFCTLLPPDLITGNEAFIPEVIFGRFRVKPGEVPTEYLSEDFHPNPKFIQILHEFLVEALPRQEGFLADVQRRGGEGWVYVIDQRTPEPMGAVPLEDILGGYEFKEGNLAGYSPNQNHLLYSRRGLFDLGAVLNAGFLRHLAALQEKSKPG